MSMGFRGLLELLGLWPSKPPILVPCLTTYVVLVASVTDYAIPTGSVTSALEGC